MEVRWCWCWWLEVSWCWLLEVVLVGGEVVLLLPVVRGGGAGGC